MRWGTVKCGIVEYGIMVYIVVRYFVLFVYVTCIVFLCELNLSNVHNLSSELFFILCHFLVFFTRARGC